MKACSRFAFGLPTEARCLAAALALSAAAVGQTGNPLHLLPFFSSKSASAEHGASPAAARPDAGDDAYIIGPGDVLAIDVWKETEISQTLPVRPDGDIALPLTGTLKASGSTPEILARQIETKLAPFISHPVVTVMVTKVVSRAFQVMGAVVRPGSYPLAGPTRVLQALAEAGGFTPFAHTGSITILHWQPDGSQIRYQFDYDAVIRGHDVDQDRELQPGDTLIVP